MPAAKVAITLAPKNPEVKPIYDAWAAFAKELGLNVEFDAGAKSSFEEMVANADALITTSIAEGFGLAFLEPWLASRWSDATCRRSPPTSNSTVSTSPHSTIASASR